MGTYNDLCETIQRQAESGKPLNAPERRGLPVEAMEMIWRLMGNLYGHKWVSSYGAEVDPDKVWSYTLAGLLKEQVQAGLRAVAEGGAEWPPSAPEFRQLCLNPGQIPVETQRIMNATKERLERERTALPPPAKGSDEYQRSRALGFEALSAIKAMVKA